MRDRAPSVEQWEHRQLDGDPAALSLVDDRRLSRVEPERRQVDGLAGEGTSNEICLAGLRRHGVEQDVVFGRGLRLKELTKCLVHEHRVSVSAVNLKRDRRVLEEARKQG